MAAAKIFKNGAAGVFVQVADNAFRKHYVPNKMLPSLRL